MRDELQPGVGKTRGTTRTDDVIHLAAAIMRERERERESMCA